MTQWNIQDIEIRTRSVEKVLVPLIAQVNKHEEIKTLRINIKVMAIHSVCFQLFDENLFVLYPLV